MMMIVRLFDVKREKVIEWINKMLFEKMIKIEIRFFLSFLSFAARVVVSRRVFLRRLFNSLSQSWRDKRRVDIEMKTDLLWWKYFLSKWNEMKFLKRVETRREFVLWTDAFDEYNMKDYFVLRSESLMSSADNMQEKLSLHSSRNTFLHNSKKILLHNSKKTSSYNSRKTFLHNSKKTFLHNSRKTFLHNLRKTSLYNSRKTLLHNSRKTLLYNLKKTSLHNSRNILLNQSRNNSRSWKKSLLIFSSDSFFQLEDILFESSDDANSMTTSKNALESSWEEIIFDHAFFVRFFSRMRSLHINLKEMQAMLWALKTWIHTFAEEKVTLYCDNQVVVNDIRKLFIKDSTMKSLRVIITLLTLHDVLIETVWISSKKNVLANQLFRAKWNQIADNFSQLQTHIVRSSRSSFDIRIWI
jgi:hypothetical protein